MVGHGILKPFLAIEHLDWIANILDADFVDGNISMVRLILDIFHVRLPWKARLR